nr:immunoglobulin heavy chain junction region [Macaca mulatta]MOY21282.1 immunoglobulin heavy chain junction region [Macaca mulatta]MOY21378.1 immunoglobulin heavy chain junction region [Macaca mulatta]MOY21639.1 immunoglobulin heavy chain junction region [Macaca mulatta]MOY21703.1 immunoglobulin heavy chain junction region [Macaca mulatta]
CARGGSGFVEYW